MMNLSHSIKVRAPAWLPESIRLQLKEQGQLCYTLQVSDAERKALRKKKPLPVSQWAERHRVLTMSSIPGPWHNRVTPYLQGIMDASVVASIETIIICAAPQTGKSEAAHNFVGHAIDRAPGPVLYVYPDENTARDNSRDRIQPMIQSSARLRSYHTGIQDDESILRINLRHMPIYLAWASSASRLANRPMRYVIFDEVDKYPDTAGKREADPISLGEKRTTTYKWNRKIWKMSTPTIEKGNIWVALNSEAQAVFDFWVRCPDCGGMLLMDFEHIRWPEDERDWKKIETRQLAWYQCQMCGSCWGDAKRNMAVRMGQWRARDDGVELFEYLQTREPKKIGFHLPAWLSYFVSLSEVASAFLQGQKKYNPQKWKEKLKDFMNNYKAEPWVDYTVERSLERIFALCDDRPSGLVPGGGLVAALTAGVDTQDNGFWYEIRAWAYGLMQESWSVRLGFLTSFEALAQVLWEDEYRDAEGNRYNVFLSVQDAMGHRTAEVYDFARRNRRRLIPLQGVERMAAPYSWTSIETYPNSRKPIPGGIKLLRANVNYYKDRLASLLEIAPADPGAWHYHSALIEEWAGHMTIEYVDESGLWQCPEGKANHGWDCSVANLVAADILGIKYWPLPDEGKAPDGNRHGKESDSTPGKGRAPRW
jgi:phage terminase large subunit GpA-like protein